MDKSDRTIDATKSSITIERCRGRERGTERRERMRRIESKTDVNLVPKRQVDLRVATSFRPLLPLNISAMGRAGKLPREDREMDDPASIIYCVTLAAGKAKLSLPLFLRVSRTLQTFLRLTPITAGPVHHCTLFIRRNLNYTFNRNVETSRRDALSATTTFLSVLNYEN